VMGFVEHAHNNSTQLKISKRWRIWRYFLDPSLSIILRRFILSCWHSWLFALMYSPLKIEREKLSSCYIWVHYSVTVYRFCTI
jgi:hypothetical protein